MTTLPQTTPLRLSRTYNAGPTAMPGNIQVAGGLAQPAGFSLTPGDVWRIIRGNLILIVALLIVASIAGWGINTYLAKHYSKFTSPGLLATQDLTNPNPLRKADPINPASLQADRATQVQLMRHDSLFSKLLQDPNSKTRATTWFKQFPVDQNVQMAKEDLRSNFSVGAVPDTRLISVSFTCSNPDDAKTVLQDLVDLHLAEQQKIIKNRQYDRSIFLGNLKYKYQSQLVAVTKDLRDKSMKINADGTTYRPNQGYKDQELYNLVQTRSGIQVQVTGAKSAMEKALAELQSGINPSQVTDAIEANDEVKQYRAELHQIELFLADNEQLGENHPTIKGVLKRRDAAQAHLDTLRAELQAKYRASYIDQLRNQAEDSQKYLDGIDKRIAELQSELSEYSNVMAQYLTAKDEEKAVNELLKQVDDQLLSITEMQDREMANLTWVKPPERPDMPSFPRLRDTMTLSLVMALALGVAIAFVRELMDTTVRSPRDITRVGQMNLLGMVPHEDDDPQSAGARLPLVIFDAPHSILAEQFRHIRTRLQHAASLDTTRSIMVTAPSPKDGKTTVACNLAAGLALNGRKILLVDADFRRPEIHRTFGLPNEVGFSNVLAGQVQFKDSVRESQVPNLSIMTSGPKPPNATELFESQLYTDFLERAAEEYDHVIFDTGPFLVVSESFAMAPRVDGVVTVVRAHKDSRGILTRMRDTLRQVKAEHLGIVLNAVRAHGGGYYGRNIKTYYAYERGNNP